MSKGYALLNDSDYLDITSGGTGANSAAGARTALGLAIGTNVQAQDATLQSISLLGTASDRTLYTTGVDTWAETPLTSAGRALIDDATAGDQRTTLGLGTIATQNANNVTISGGAITGITDLAVADGGTGASNASDARTNLGLGTIATQASNNVTITGGSITGITDLTVTDGGTGQSSFTDGGVVCGNGMNALSVTSAGTAGQVLTSNGAGNDPTFQNAAGGGVIASGSLGSAATTLTVSSIPAYDSYRVVIHIPTDLSDANSTICLRFNGDSGNNYIAKSISNTSSQNNGSTPDSKAVIDAATASNDPRAIDITIVNLAASAKFLTGTAMRSTGTAAGAARPIAEMYTAQWDNTADQINSITLLTSDGTTTMPTGTRMIIWGGSSS